MDLTEKITKIAQVTPSAGLDADGTQVQQPIVYPNNFANNIGWLAAINTAIDNVSSKMSAKGINARNIIFQHKIREKLYEQYVYRIDSPQFQELKNALRDLGFSDPFSINTSTIPNIATAIEGKAPDEDENTQEVVKQINAFVGNFQTTSKIELQINNDPNFKLQLRNDQLQKQKTGLPITANADGLVIISQALQDTQPQQANPLEVDKFKSLEHLKQTLLQMGPRPETYTKIFELVGPENEDSAKSALTKFFEGSPAGLGVLYDLLIKAGVASPVDEEIVGELMSKHPQVFENQKQAATSCILKQASVGGFMVEAIDGKTVTVKNEWDFVTLAKDLGLEVKEPTQAKQVLEAACGKEFKVAGYFGQNYKDIVASYNGLYVPPPDAGCKTMEKVAASNSNDESYTLYGPDEKRMCPKTRGVVSTFTCRYHCLDGLAIGDHQILCGEAIWRRNVMDKFSTEYVNKEGKLEGGYIRDRFEVENNTHEHPALLKPGQRAQPINEDAWSTEKRLVEVRKSEGEKRGYEGVYEPKDLYNFDQHELVKGPEAPELAKKEKDPVAKFAQIQNPDAAAMGEDQKVVCGEECPQCKAKFKTGTGICQRCNVKNVPYYMSKALQETKAIQQPSVSASVANGVYKVTMDGQSAFGSTIKEAQSKLAPTAPSSVQDVENALTDVIQEAPVQRQPAVIKSPMMQQQPVQPVAQPVQPAQPLPIIPDAIADMGEGEPVDLIESDDDDTHIGAEELDSHLESTADPINDIQERTQEFAQYGLGPKGEK